MKRYHIYYVMMILPVFFSCKKFMNIDPPKNTITSSTTFSDSATATSAVLGIYNQMMFRSDNYAFYFANGGITIYTGLSSDEIYATKNKPDEIQFYSNAISSSNNPTNANNFWITAYKLIYQANACIEGITQSNSLTTNLKNQLIGECKFIRSFFYFNLVNIYGDVPLVTGTDFHVNTIMPRTSTDSVFRQLEKDLSDASQLMSENYPSDGRVRPNKYAATALLAKVFLYEKKWTDAESTAGTVINSGAYQLETDLNNIFLATSTEAICQVSPVLKGWETTEGVILITFNKPALLPSYVISDHLLNAFEEGDLRRVSWIDSNIVGGVNYYWPYKYHLGYDRNSTPAEPYMILRLSDLYLIRAEARAMLGNTDQSEEDLNAIRARALLAPVTTTDQTLLLDSILHERQIEFFCEWGNRWYDLKRTGRINNVLGAEKTGWKPEAALYPIPLTEITTNPSLKQNPGYE